MAALAYLFYNSWLAAILLSPMLAVYLQLWQKECMRRKELIFREQFRQSIQVMASAMHVGYAVENAVRETAEEIKLLYKKEDRICREFDMMIGQLNMNLTAEQVLKEFAQRTRQEDVRDFVTVFAAAKRTGGDSIAIIRDSVKMLSGKMEIEQEIETLLAAKKLEFNIMCVVPFGIIFYMRLAFPEFMSVLYGNILGAVLMSGCMGIYFLAYWLGRKLLRTEEI